MCINACVTQLAALAPDRWELYKVLGDPARLRVLALAAEEELSIGELTGCSAIRSRPSRGA